MDLDGDGIRDLISGGDTGEAFFFPGRPDGRFGPREALTDRSGGAIALGTGSSVHAADWDGDGDLDLLIGNREGELFLCRNRAEGPGLTLDPSQRVEAGGRAVWGSAGEAAPWVHDWDGDGRSDLLLGNGDGSVTLYRNTADKGEPRLEAPLVLIPMSPSFAPDQTHYDPVADRGISAKVCVADWNGDGRDDLLVGLTKGQETVPPELSPAQEARRDSLTEVYQELMMRTQDVRARISERVLTSWGLQRWQRPPEARREEFNRLVQEGLEKDADYITLRAKMSEVIKLRRPLLPDSGVHGWVWVYLRRP